MNRILLVVLFSFTHNPLGTFLHLNLYHFYIFENKENNLSNSKICGFGEGAVLNNILESSSPVVYISYVLD